MIKQDTKEHEVAFCGDVKSWVDVLFDSHPDWPFSHAKIEQYGQGSRRRSDLRIFRKGSSTPVLAGEVKFPGTAEGRSPYDELLVRDAFNKADNIQAPYFFTWNVNKFVLFDRSKWDVPMIERRVREWDLGMNLISPADCAQPEVHRRIRERLLPEIFAQFALIVEGKLVDWGMPPDDVFLRSLESNLDWPVIGTREYLLQTCHDDRAFAGRFQSWMAEEMNWTFDPDDEQNWKSTLERAASTLCYVFCNRAIFYEAIRAKYPQGLRKLVMPVEADAKHDEIYARFRSQFRQAVIESGDYEPIFYPEVDDWAGALIFGSEKARQGWKGVFANLAHYNFREIPYDIVGGIFQKLISPEERQKFGQFYTNEDIIDVINAFCIRGGGDNVLDPACGSGSFLVRAYHRKAWLAEHARGRRRLDTRKEHHELLREIYGCDIALFAAHLATLNMAARRIEDEENYPYIARGNFFELAERRERFCYVPGNPKPSGEKEQKPVWLPTLDAVIGNPPYIRQEQIPRRSDLRRQKGETDQALESRKKTTKEHLHELCQRLWPELKLSGRSDLHCYFWPVASKFLTDNGYFGFLTSSSWLDVEYGFALQGWILKNFKLITVIESLDEPWFQDARVKTAVTILQRCDEEKARMKNLVRFVRLLKPIRKVLGERPHGDEAARQNAAERLRRLILETKSPRSTDALRIVPVPQAELWSEGVRASHVLKSGVPSDVEEPDESRQASKESKTLSTARSGYAAGKWGRYLRAPDIYFKLLREYGDRFVRLGEIAEVRRGITSGCDAFFMPRDVTERILNELKDGLPWYDVPLMTHCKRSEIESGEVRIVRAGDGTLHPIETKYLRPELHTLMEVDRPVIRAKDVDRVVLWVNEPLNRLGSTYAAKYIRWGAKQTFTSKKSKAVPVSERSSCASRPIWYDLTNAGIGVVFWPMAQKYRHITPTNPDGLVCNHNLFYISTPELKKNEATALGGILNSTIIALVKHFYGRYAGSEGTLKTEVVDTVLLEIPDPRKIRPELAHRISKALKAMTGRKVTHLVEEALLECHSEEAMRIILQKPIVLPKELQQEDRRELDDCVFQLLGVVNPRARARLLDELYLETAKYYRYQRTQDIQAMENRAGNNGRRLGPAELAESIWVSLDVSERGVPVADWLRSMYEETETIEVPEGVPRPLGASDMFNPSTVIFNEGKHTFEITYGNPAQAALAAQLARLGIRGVIQVPSSESDCEHVLQEMERRLADARERFTELAGSRTGTQSLQEKTRDLLLSWYIHGKNP